MFTVATNDSAVTRQICEMAAEIRLQLSSCGLNQSVPVTIELAEEVSHPLGHCLAYFDCESNLIRLKEPSEYETVLDPDEPYAELPPDVLFRALLTHELTHALVTQSAGERQVNIVDQEYVAAAMELDLMEPKYREIIVDAAPVDLPPKEALIDIWIYGFAPRKFAVNAWQHFRAQEDSCGFVQQIVAGEESFAKAARPELR